jgi:DNA-binding CsgD family transcriptional regulator
MEQEIVALIVTGRFAAARRVLDDMSALHPPEYRFRYLSAALSLACGDLERAREHQMRREELLRGLAYIPFEDAAVHRAAIYRALGERDREVSWAHRFLDATAHTDSPLMASIAAYVGFYALSTEEPSAAARELRDVAYRALSFAQAGLALSWEGTWHAAHLSFAQAYAARLEGRSAVETWATAFKRAARIGGYFALQPRLELAAELLRVGDRSVGKEQLVGIWLAARDMGAGWYERQAAALATRNRVPLPGKDEAGGPLHRLTPREREVLALLGNGATDKDVAATLVISPRTASIHVGNILAKLQVPNRGAAAKLARDMGLDAPGG